jgi:hypothetical protein
VAARARAGPENATASLPEEESPGPATPWRALSRPRLMRPIRMGRMRRTYRPAPPPVETNEQVITGWITVGWAAALITTALLRNQLPPGGHWWIWTCATGTAMGLFGLWYVPHFKRARARLARRQAERLTARHPAAGPAPAAHLPRGGPAAPGETGGSAG